MRDFHLERYWHCRIAVHIPAQPETLVRAVIHDLTREALLKTLVNPWRTGSPFSIAGVVVTDSSRVAEIQITRTPYPASVYVDRAEALDQSVRARSLEPEVLPFEAGTDYTNELLFHPNDLLRENLIANVELVINLCGRLRESARVLGNRRKGKLPFQIRDEYDVQDLLHAVLRGYIKHTVQEEPVGKVAGTKAGRADLAIETLGVIIEAKYARDMIDQKRIFEEFTQDLTLYAAWVPLRHLILLVYESDRLRDPEALEGLTGPKEIGGRRFAVHVILS